ncbi:MAG: hypothetical protein JW723_04245 [Bacteroidales bacterium]|nr:hypothetical protein [Bacteroidales bacterium]
MGKKGLFRKMNIRFIQMFCFLAIIYSGCEKDNDPEDSNLDPVTDGYDAEYLIRHIAEGVIDAVLDDLSHGTYSGTIVNGISGNASVSGDYYYTSGIDCGTDCVRSEKDIDLTVVFSNYKVMSCDNCEATITGTVYYTDNTWSRQSGLSYSSGGRITVEGEDVAFKEVYDGSWGYSDVISFYASRSPGDSFSGWCIPQDGNTYDFD